MVKQVAFKLETDLGVKTMNIATQEKSERLYSVVGKKHVFLPLSQLQRIKFIFPQNQVHT